MIRSSLKRERSLELFSCLPPVTSVILLVAIAPYATLWSLPFKPADHSPAQDTLATRSLSFGLAASKVVVVQWFKKPDEVIVEPHGEVPLLRWNFVDLVGISPLSPHYGEYFGIPYFDNYIC